MIKRGHKPVQRRKRHRIRCLGFSPIDCWGCDKQEQKQYFDALSVFQGGALRVASGPESVKDGANQCYS